MSFNISNNWGQVTSDARNSIVFKNRFKGYGAYQLRRSYRRNQLYSMAVITVMLFIGSALTSFRKGEGENIKRIAPPNKTVVCYHVYDEQADTTPVIAGERGNGTGTGSAESSGAPRIGDNEGNGQVADPGEWRRAGGHPGSGGGPGDGDYGDGEIPGGNAPGANKPQGGKSADVYASSRYPQGEEAFTNYVKEQFQYPENCLEFGIQAALRVRFTVDQYGRLDNIAVLGAPAHCDEFRLEAERIFRESRLWIPATLNGKAVQERREVALVITITD